MCGGHTHFSSTVVAGGRHAVAHLRITSRSLAFALLDVLIGDDHNNKRLAYLSQKGFIRHCLDAFQDQEQDTNVPFIFSTDDGAPSSCVGI